MTDRFKIINLYSLMLLTLACQCIPVDVVQIFSLLMLFILITANRFVRQEQEKDSFLYQHSFFISRTLWMASIILTIGAVLAGFYLADHFGLQGLLNIGQSLAHGKTDTPEAQRILWSVVAGIVPGLIYLIQRAIRGLLKAVKNQNPAKYRTFL